MEPANSSSLGAMGSLIVAETKMEPVNNSSLGAMGSLLRNLDELLDAEERAKGLISDLRIISTKMEKLSEVHSPSDTVKFWMNDAHELSHDMEVCVDQFVHASQPEDLPAKVAWILTWTREILGFEARVKEVNQRFEKYNLVNEYCKNHCNPAKIVVSHHVGTLYKEPNPVGMEEPTNKRPECLMPRGDDEEDLKLKVVSVHGDEGVGKSTIIKRLWQESSSETKMEPVNSSSLGAMGSLLRNLDELLHAEERAKGLISDLRIISTKMEKLSQVHSPSDKVKFWMNDARELSYDIEDCVDQFVHASQPEDLPAKVAWILTWTRGILGYEARVKMINQRCESYNLVNEYCKKHCNPAKIVVSHHLRTLYKEPSPVGMEEPTNKLLKWLMPMGHDEEDLKLKVVSVLGEEGVGKSTLVKRLWQESSQHKFDFKCRAFVQTAKKPDTRMILRSILSQVQPKQPLNTCKVPKLIQDLREHLQDKRYFIVIDGLWDVAVWHIIKGAFPAGNQRIITTTSVEKVARVCCGYDSNSIVNVKRLCGDEAKKLFVKAFGSEESPPQFNDVTDEITRKCGGFPLAIICTARLVASQPETEKEQQLDYITKFLPNNFSTHSSSMEILNQVLKLCYSSLPHCLKTCLLYLSVYPENYIFFKEDLMKQWIAEDFICTPEGKDIADIAGSYFDELLSLGLMQRMDINSNKKDLLSYTVHPVVFDFISCKSMEDNFVTIKDYSQSTLDLREKVRRLSLHFGSATYATTPGNVELSQVRSLSFVGLLGCMPSIAEFKHVRVMNLHIFSDDAGSRFSLSEICHLFQLRYLLVRCNVTVELPNQMQYLKHLGTLEINARVGNFPSDFDHISRLQHVRLGEKTKRSASAIASGDWSRMPCPSISLESFELLPPICIFSRLPQWFLQLLKLRVLEIVVGQLPKDDIDAIAELPVLKHLSLYVRTPPTRVIILSSGMFPALEYFKFVCGLLQLGFEKGTLPNLRRLKLVFNADKREQNYGCILLGISHLLSLQRVAANIGLAPGAEESDRIAAESAFKGATRQHPCHGSFEEVVKCVDPVDEMPQWNLDVILAKAKIVEAKIEEYNSEYLQKYYPPVLRDPVWRLACIRKEGMAHMKLKGNNIETVQEFLRMLTVKPDEMRAILGDVMTDHRWEVTTRHAKTCVPGDKVYIYNTVRDTIYLDSIFNLLKVEIGGTEYPLQLLNREQTMLVRQLILEAYENRHILVERPSLDDSVWVLENIAKEGVFHNKLEHNNIKTVRDFVRMLMVKPDELRTILGDHMTDCMWVETTKHARTFDPGDKVYLYTAGSATIYVNSVFNLVKVEIGGIDCPLQQLNWDQMVLVLPLIMEAYEHRHDLQETSAVTFDGDATDNIALLRARFVEQVRGDLPPVINMVPNPWIIQ